MTSVSVHTTAMAVALQHQLTAAGIGGLLKPAQGVGVGVGVGGGISGLTATQQSSASALQLANDGDANTSTLTLLDPPGALLHPALRNVKAINIGEAGGDTIDGLIGQPLLNSIYSYRWRPWTQAAAAGRSTFWHESH